MESIFEKEFEGFDSYPSLTQDLEVEVAIVGGGLAGLLCAYHLQKAGHKVAVFEMNKIAKATTARSTAVLTGLQNPMYTRLIKKSRVAGDYFRAQKEALLSYKEIIAEHNIDCDFEIKPAYLYAPTNSASSASKTIKKLKKEYETMQSLGDDIASDIKWVDSEFGPAIKLEEQAQFNVLKFLQGLPKDFDIYEDTRIVDFILKDKLLKTQKGYTIKADKIIIATRFPAIISEVYPFKMYQAKSYCIAFKHEPLEATYNGAEDTSLYMRSYGDYLILGGFDHRAGRHKKNINYYDKLKTAAQELFGVDENDIAAAWSAMDTVTYDGVPFAGSVSKNHRDVYLITGFNEWGMLNGMICSRIIASAIDQKQDEFYKVFSTYRPYCAKNIDSLVPHLLIAVGSLVKGLFQGKKRCGHIGCGLRYNKIENVYECPCHGSRYDANGKLLDGPATKCVEIKKKIN